MKKKPVSTTPISKKGQNTKVGKGGVRTVDMMDAAFDMGSHGATIIREGLKLTKIYEKEASDVRGK